MDLGGLSPQQLARLIAFAQAGDDEQVNSQELHDAKNAPWVNGEYAHLLDAHGHLKGQPPYVHQAYPKMLYSAGYTKAAAAYVNARGMRAKRGDDEEREYLIAVALQARDDCTRTVHDPGEQAALGPMWCETPAEAAAAQEKLELDIARAAAESNFDDRNMGELAKREREVIDENSDGHLVEVAQTPIPTHQKKR